MDIGNIRKDFNAHQALEKARLADNPFVQFEQWFNEVLNAQLAEPNAFVIATVVEGKPSQRAVLLKYFDEDGFVFFTNYQSRKALEIKINPQVSMSFPWFAMQRQIQIEGRAEKISRAQSLQYFLSRPRDSQIGAWCSAQSQVIDSKKLLLSKWQELKEKFAEKSVPIPDFWGGYRIRPSSFEFWQGQPNRLHDRFKYSLIDDKWTIQQLAP